jgi:hypothetical protein
MLSGPSRPHVRSEGGFGLRRHPAEVASFEGVGEGFGPRRRSAGGWAFGGFERGLRSSGDGGRLIRSRCGLRVAGRERVSIVRFPSGLRAAEGAGRFVRLHRYFGFGGGGRLARRELRGLALGANGGAGHPKGASVSGGEDGSSGCEGASAPGLPGCDGRDGVGWIQRQEGIGAGDGVRPRGRRKALKGATP